MIRSLLIANRGEIACRVIRTAKRMGIRTVAVYSDADAEALHVRRADEAVHIGPSPARESYLRGDRIVEAALATGAEAIHPGYGFLSENADFADAVIAAGLVWVGAPPAAIRAMGLKDAAKQRMIAAGVPVTPGYMGADQSPERLRTEADAIGYPVLIKAVAGGGGKGMRRVDDPAAFAEALESCRREASSSFGDDRVLLEKYILSPRHIEVQVFGDTHGQVVHLFERDCSLQRRHQKVIEEAPAPGMDEATRHAICGAAVRAAEAVDYVGAGTIEFIADASEGLRADRIWFMEMNTRLQVEHPVTEEITGQDLVEWQLRVASGEPLPCAQDELSITGWAMEARLYAEDPAKGFLPSVGRLEKLKLAREKTRIETGYETGDTVSAFYDPLLAKLIVHEEHRGAAAERLSHTAACVLAWPVRTNSFFLSRCLDDPEFTAGHVDTGLIGRKLEALTMRASPEPKTRSIGIGELLERSKHPELAVRPTWRQRERGRVSEPTGFRLNAAPQTEFWLQIDSELTNADLSEAVGGIAWTIEWVTDGVVVSNDDGQLVRFDLVPARGHGAGPAGNGSLLAPMPGRITAVAAEEGAAVIAGQTLVTLEAMKMEQALVAPFDGRVAEVRVEVGAQVTEGALLVRVELASEPSRSS